MVANIFSWATGTRVSFWTVFGVLAVAALLIITREPALVEHPRFFADEAEYYFPYAYNHSWLSAFLHAQNGYYSFLPNVTSLIAAHLLPLELAPVVSTYVGLIFMLMPHVLIWLGRSDIWPQIWQKVLASLLLLYVPQDDRMWLSSISSHFYLSVCVFLMLVDRWEGMSGRRLTAYSALLALSAFSGPVSCFMTPVFLYKAWRHPGGEGWIFSSILLAACALHGIIFLRVLLWNDLDMSKFRSEMVMRPSLLNMLKSTFKYFMAGFMSWLQDRRFFTIMLGSWRFALMPFISLSIIGGTLWYFSRQLSREERVLFIGSFMLLTFMSCLMSSHAEAPKRYFYVTNIIVMLMIARHIGGAVKEAGWRGPAASVLVGLILASGMYNFHSSFTAYNPRWPLWTDEVAHWQDNSNYVLDAHPPGSWPVHLVPRHNADAMDIKRQ